MKHLIICDYGAFLGLNSHRLMLRQDDKTRHFERRLCGIFLFFLIILG